MYIGCKRHMGSVSSQSRNAWSVREGVMTQIRLEPAWPGTRCSQKVSGSPGPHAATSRLEGAALHNTGGLTRKATRRPRPVTPVGVSGSACSEQRGGEPTASGHQFLEHD
ncbi:unnamed protein product [Boreogadus saida]